MILLLIICHLFLKTLPELLEHLFPHKCDLCSTLSNVNSHESITVSHTKNTTVLLALNLKVRPLLELPFLFPYCGGGSLRRTSSPASWIAAGNNVPQVEKLTEDAELNRDHKLQSQMVELKLTHETSGSVERQPNTLLGESSVTKVLRCL